MIPLIIAGAAAAAAAAGGGAAMKVGNNSYRAKSFDKTASYDAGRFEYAPEGADAIAKRYAGLAAGAQNRAAPTANYSSANMDRGLGLQARGQQAGAAGLMMQRAQGLVPSISQMQADRQMQQATAAQASAGASARGAAGLAMAQQNAAGNTATMQSAISNQAQINGAQERMAAEQAAYSAYGGLRGGDLASQQQSAQQAQYQAQMQAQQRAQNDQMTLGMTGYETGVRQAQLQAGVQQQTILANSLAGQQTINSGVTQNNANREMEFLKMGIGAAQGGASAAIPGKASGGPIAAGKPYVVGEQGPEIIVPASSGTVIPNHVSMGLMGVGNEDTEWPPPRPARRAMPSAWQEMGGGGGGLYG